MNAQIIKIIKIVHGIQELMTLMDKGFGKIESDDTLTKVFKTLIYSTQNQLDLQHRQLIHLENTQSIEDKKLETADCLNHLRNTFKNSISRISAFIIDYEIQWKKSTALQLLKDYRNTLSNYALVLEKEIDQSFLHLHILKRQELLDDIKKEKINLQ